jgi:peptidoglycan hydrolase-like protein with peptidoglycan-binding domain
VQHLFQQLGYPLGDKPLGGLGVRTRGALSYFQRKYGLPVTGYPDALTIAKMQAVAKSLQGSHAKREPPPRDLVERVLGNGLPILAIAIAPAVLLALLALSARNRTSQDSATAEGTMPAASGDT